MTEENKLKPRLLFAFFVLAGVNSVFAMANLARIPAEAENAVWMGFSAQRLALLGGMAGVAIICFALAIRTLADKNWQRESISRLETWLESKTAWGAALLMLLLSVTGSFYFVLLGTEISEPYTQAYFARLSPLALWITGTGVLALIVLPPLRYGRELSELWPRNGIVYLIVGIFGFFLLAWALVAWTQTGLAAESVGWNRLGAPILETQVVLAWLAGLGFLGLSAALPKSAGKVTWMQGWRQATWAPDLIISLIIWLSAAALWQSIPLDPSWFAAPPRPPNFEYYPNSDASVYDITGQSALVGQGFKSWGTPFAVRPMYALFLSIVHSLSGLAYEPIILLQVGILAFFPVVMYWLAKAMFNRFAGVMAAALVILREANAIALAEDITVSHAKLLMADLPTALGLALITLLTVTWLQSPEKRKTYPFIAGGLVGLFMLVRPEVGVQLPFIGLVAIFVLKQPRRWLAGGLMMGVGVGLLLLPWIWRNYQLTGKIFLDSPGYRADLLARRYSPDPAQNEIEIQPDETGEEFTERMSESAVTFARENPTSVTNFVLNHYANSQIQTILMFPASIRIIDSAIAWSGHRSIEDFWQQCCSVKGYVRRLPFWWQWDGQLPNQSILLVLANLCILATGLALAWKRQKITGMLPLIVLSAHLLINAAVRNSGGRYILPVDWAMIVYYAIGLAQLTLWGAGYFSKRDLPKFAAGREDGGPEDNPTENRNHGFPVKATIGLGAVMLLAGFALPLAEKAIAPRYTEAIKQEKVLSLFNSAGKDLEKSHQIEPLEQFLAGGGSVALGRALYPRFHEGELGEAGDTWQTFIPRAYPRISFHLVGPHEQGVILPYEGVPESFPHGSDVLVFGCPGEDYFDALAVVVYAAPERIYLRSPLPELGCPLR